MDFDPVVACCSQKYYHSEISSRHSVDIDFISMTLNLFHHKATIVLWKWQCRRY